MKSGYSQKAESQSVELVGLIRSLAGNGAEKEKIVEELERRGVRRSLAGTLTDSVLSCQSARAAAPAPRKRGLKNLLADWLFLWDSADYAGRPILNMTLRPLKAMVAMVFLSTLGVCAYIAFHDAYVWNVNEIIREYGENARVPTLVFFFFVALRGLYEFVILPFQAPLTVLMVALGNLSIFAPLALLDALTLTQRAKKSLRNLYRAGHIGLSLPFVVSFLALTVLHALYIHAVSAESFDGLFVQYVVSAPTFRIVLMTSIALWLGRNLIVSMGSPDKIAAALSRILHAPIGKSVSREIGLKPGEHLIESFDCIVYQAPTPSAALVTLSRRAHLTSERLLLPRGGSPVSTHLAGTVSFPHRLKTYKGLAEEMGGAAEVALFPVKDVGLLRVGKLTLVRVIFENRREILFRPYPHSPQSSIYSYPDEFVARLKVIISDIHAGSAGDRATKGAGTRI